jgi:photosystem II stability/assembly factor-like uncharacterized protein
VARLYVAGGSVVSVIENGSVETGLEGRGARCLALDPKHPDTLYVGTSDEGIFKSEDVGGTWEKLSGIEHPRVTAVAVSPTDGAVYAGTEPSALFVSRDGGESWRELEGMSNLPSAPTWSFPPRPWTSHVRAIALSYSDPNLVVAGIELGGVVRSADGGETWQDQRPGAQADCHSLFAHPGAPELLYEAGGGGFAQSTDFGESWEAWPRTRKTPRSSTPRRPRDLAGRTVEDPRMRPSTAGQAMSGGSRSSKACPHSPMLCARTRRHQERCTPASETGRYSAP